MNSKNLFHTFTDHTKYDKYQKRLVHHIITFLEHIIITCKKKSKTLHNILCQFSLEYTDLSDYSTLVNGMKTISHGKYGEVYDSGSFLGIPIITKSPLFFDTNSINEIFVSFVLINQLLLTYKQLEKYLVPTYGIFVCDHSLQNGKLTICGNENKCPYIHLVQQKRNGITLSDTLEQGLEYKEFKLILKKICNVLIILEINKLYHNDLHNQNILIENNNPVLIDFGMASFIVDGINYFNHWQLKYIKHQPLYSGAYDILFLLKSCIHDTNNIEIKHYCKHIITQILRRLWKDVNVPFMYEDFNKYFLYDVLVEKEGLLPSSQRSIVHEHNMQQLSILTYEYITNMIYTFGDLKRRF